MTAMKEGGRLSYGDALALIPPGDEVHTLIQAGSVVIGQDMPRGEILEILARCDIRAAGAQAQALGHGLVALTPAGPLFIATRPARPLDHSACPPQAHDRSLPDEGGRPWDQPYDEQGHLSDKQAMAEDGLLGCNDCGRPLFYCRTTENYHHVDRAAECFLVAAW